MISQRAISWKSVVTYVLPILLLLVFPFFSSSYQTNLLAKFLTYSIVALSLDLLWGFAGILSFAHSVFFGLGSYGLALALKNFEHLPGATYLGLLLAVLVPALLALFLGYAMFYSRVGGVYFAIVTFTLGSIVQLITIVWVSFTGGHNGLYGFPDPALGIPGIKEISITTTDLSAYYLIAITLILSYVLVRHLKNSPFGRTLKAINDNEKRVAFLGYSIPAIKLAVFVISCALAGLAGAIYVPVGFVSPDIMGIVFSTSIIVWVAIGGRGTLYGAVIGALVVNYLQVFMSDILTFYWFMFIGLFFIVVVLFVPDGLVGVVKRIRRLIKVD